MRAPVGRRSPASRRNLEKSEHTRHPPSSFPSSHLSRHLALTLRPRALGFGLGAPAGRARDLPFSRLCWRRRGPRPAPCRHPPPPLPAGIGPVPEERQRPPQRPQEGRRRRAPQAMPLPGCSGGGRCERRRGSWRGAAAAAAAAEGPRAGGGGGGREGHR